MEPSGKDKGIWPHSLVGGGMSLEVDFKLSKANTIPNELSTSCLYSKTQYKYETTQASPPLLLQSHSCLPAAMSLTITDGHELYF